MRRAWGKPRRSLTADDFTGLYKRLAQPLLLYFQRRVHEPELAADLLAETFERAIRNGPQFRGATDSELSGWLWSIAQSVLGENDRREQSERRRADRLGVPPLTLSDREIERIEELAGLAGLRNAVASGLAALPEEQREAVRLRVLEDVPYEEIARRMGTSGDTARARVSRGLRTLSVTLREDHQAWREG
ncbi:MAG TPA: RNA polymerase sigma factor [Solirubrobacteraceae bacterium]|nr:RNA polymerase sigma factor [Solirubrobacteraceae bacterium]